MKRVYVVTNNIENSDELINGVFTTNKAAIEFCAEKDAVESKKWKQKNSLYIIHEQELIINKRK